MKILVIAHGLRAAGGRVVALNLLDSFLRIDKTNEYCIIVPDQPEYRALKLEGERTHVTYYRRKLSHLGRVFFDAFTLKRMARDFGPDVILGLGNLGFVAPAVPQAIWTMHPYLFYDLKQVGPIPPVFRLQIAFLRRHFRRQLPATRTVFCQTATMEKRLRDFYGYQGRTMVIDNAVSTFPDQSPADLVTPEPLAHHKQKFKLFYLTRYYPHKGLEVLFEVMDRYREELADVAIVITIEASHGKGAVRLLKLIEERGLESQIINVGPLPKAALPAYYGACDGLVMPTRLESFSSAYIEAMHFGIPILTSDLDFAREVCADAALYFDPCDPAAIRDMILTLKADAALRARLVARGRERLGAFSVTWDEHAGRMLEELREIAGHM